MKKAVEKISLIGANRIYIVVCLLLALIITFRIYPFIGLADGFSRWDMAIEIYQNGHIIKDTLLSPVLPYLKAITYALTNSYALFTYIQCALFYISIGILAKTLGGGGDFKAYIYSTMVHCC